MHVHLPGWHHSPSSPLYLRQHRLGLGQPEGHLHRPVQRRWRGQRGAGLLRLAGLGIQCAKAPAAVRLERAHAEFFGQGEGLLVVGLGRLDLWGIAVRGDLAEEPQGLGLVSPFFVLAGELEGTLGKLACVLHAAGQQIGLAHAGTGRADWKPCRIEDACATACSSSGRASADPPEQGIRRA